MRAYLLAWPWLDLPPRRIDSDLHAQNLHVRARAQMRLCFTLQCIGLRSTNTHARTHPTVADFAQALANLHDKFGHELQMLVETFRKRNGELRKDR